MNSIIEAVVENLKENFRDCRIPEPFYCLLFTFTLYSDT